MISAFNPQTFRGKLAKLNYTQKSIETLSYWCIFHMINAKQIVETWARQFYCSPRSQRLAYLYLANDILQNSRSKGSAFVNEFWTVLPDALRSIIKIGDENGKKALTGLLNIWDERKVFGSKSRLLKEEVAGRRHMKNNFQRSDVASSRLPTIMASTFNPQILVEKLAKLNNTQQSIETLSHWCIFHMHKAKQVVETWARQFHCSPREQRLAYLYLANDILQNSRRKGSEFVGEFWKVLPDALRNVIESGDENGKKASIRLVNIWDERKVFGSRGQLLKEEVAGRHVENSNRNEKLLGSKLRPSAGNMLDKIVSDYQVVYGGQLDEDVIVSKCKNASSCIEKAGKEIESDLNSGNAIGSAIVEELQGQHSVLRNCIEQLVAVESSRVNLVSHLREALKEEELKMDQTRNELQAAQSQSELASNLCRQVLDTMKEAQVSEAPSSSLSASVPVMYTRRDENSADDTRAAAAAVAAKLTASTSSAQMLTYVLSSLASEGVIGNSMNDSSSSDHPPGKKPKLKSDHPQPPEGLIVNEQPPPPLSPPPLPPPLPPMQPYPVPPAFQVAGPMNMPFGYTPLQPPAMTGYPLVGPPMMNGLSPYVAPPNHYQSIQGSEGGLYNQSSSFPMAPISRQ